MSRDFALPIKDTVSCSLGTSMDNESMEQYMKCFHDTFGFYPPEYTPEPEAATPVYRVCYPEEWYQPTNRFEKGLDRISTWNMVRYSPYKRISHFREHLNRLQFCQFVTIPNEVYHIVGKHLSSLTTLYNNVSLYIYVKLILKEYGYSNYNEHIHHLISFSTKQYIDITYEDRALMCTLFIQLEHVFQRTSLKEPNSKKRPERKNIFSYYLIVQLVLYLFHYHPNYLLPTLLDDSKRQQYYLFLLQLFAQTPIYQHVITLHFIRKKKCQSCVQSQPLFDDELVSMV